MPTATGVLPGAAGDNVDGNEDDPDDDANQGVVVDVSEEGHDGDKPDHRNGQGDDPAAGRAAKTARS